MTLDFSSPIHYLWALLPEVVLAGTGLLVLTLDVFQRGDRSGPSHPWVRWTAVVGVLVALGVNGYLLGFDAPMRSGMIAMDSFRVATNFVILGATLLSLLFAFDFLRREGLDIGEFYFLMLMAAVGMMLLAGSRDLIVVFVSVELMSLAVYVLTGINRKDARSAEGALKYFLMGAFASGFLLYGIALLFGATGSTNLALVTSEVARGAADGNLLLIAGVALVVVGFAFKISAVPFHMWTPDVYEGAPTPVTGFMAAGVKAAGFAALLRIVTVELAPAASTWTAILWWLAVLTMIVPNLIALAQDSVKRMLAYSSIAHAGYLLVGVVVGTASGRSAALLYLAVYAVMTLGAFAIVGAVAGGDDSRGGLADFRGLGWQTTSAGRVARRVSPVIGRLPPDGRVHREAVSAARGCRSGPGNAGGGARPYELRVVLLLPSGHLEDVLRRCTGGRAAPGSAWRRVPPCSRRFGCRDPGSRAASGPGDSDGGIRGPGPCPAPGGSAPAARGSLGSERDEHGLTAPASRMRTAPRPARAGGRRGVRRKGRLISLTRGFQ